MRILIITQRVDIADSNLGFFHRWILEFAKNCEQVVVIAQQVGEYRFPPNVRVLSLGKERKVSKFRQLANFYLTLGRELKNSDVVFAHMIPLWVVAGWPLYKIFNKKVYLWYVHRSVTPMLRLAEKIVVKIFTASRESFRLPSKKAEIVGHGIDTEYFAPRPEVRTRGVYRILTAGRISESKRIKEMISAIAELYKNFSDEKKLEFAIVGDARLPADEKYLAELKRLIAELKLDNTVKFLGGVPYDKMAAEYQKSDLFLNFSLTGSIDKAVLEAMACGCDILTANEAFFDLLSEENIARDIAPQKIARRIAGFIKNDNYSDILRALILQKYDLAALIKKLVVILKQHNNT